MTPTDTRLAGCHLYLTLTREDGTQGTATVHVEASGHVGVSAPVWANPQDVARDAATLCRMAADALTQRAADDAAWR